ncbi:hypothetical protein Drorol1_Dr00002905 [Drosera rotundifolia]
MTTEKKKKYNPIEKEKETEKPKLKKKMFALHSAASFTLVLPFFPATTTSSEDQDEEIEVQTDYAVAKILSSIPVSGGRLTDLVAYDIRYLQIVFSKIYSNYSPYTITTKLRQGYPRGYHVVIVCDLALSEETLISCQVSAYVTHAVFLNCSWERFLHNDDGFENRFTHFSHIWITDSCPATVKAIGGRAPFEVLSLAPSIAEVLRMDRDD